MTILKLYIRMNLFIVKNKMTTIFTQKKKLDNLLTF